jgi:hypothetical protein
MVQLFTNTGGRTQGCFVQIFLGGWPERGNSFPLMLLSGKCTVTNCTAPYMSYR